VEVSYEGGDTETHMSLSIHRNSSALNQFSRKSSQAEMHF